MEMVAYNHICYVSTDDPEWFLKVYLLFWEGELRNKETGEVITTLYGIKLR